MKCLLSDMREEEEGEGGWLNPSKGQLMNSLVSDMEEEEESERTSLK